MQSEIISQEKPPILKNNTLPTKRSHNKKSNTSDLSLENFDETSNDGAAPFSPAISVQSKESKSSTASRKRKKDSSVKIKKIVKKDKKEKEIEPVRNPNKKYLNVRGYNFFIPDTPTDEIENFEPSTEEVTFQGLTLKITKYEKEKPEITQTEEDLQTSPELETLPSCDSNKSSTNDNTPEKAAAVIEEVKEKENQSSNLDKSPIKVKSLNPDKKDMKQPLSLNSTPTRRLLKSTEKRKKPYHDGSSASKLVMNHDNSESEPELLEPRLTRKKN